MSVIKLNAAAVSAINAVASAQIGEERATLAAIPVLRTAFKGCTPEDIRNTLVVNFAAVYGIEVKVQGSGRCVLPKDDPRSNTASKALNRFMARLIDDTEGQGKAKAESAAVEVPAHIAKLAAQLAKACNEYEQAKKLASTALSAAFAQ